MRYIIFVILYVNNILAHSQVITDSLHCMYYYEVSTKMRNIHPFLFCGISDKPIEIDGSKTDLNRFMESFYKKVSYCPDISSGLMHLPMLYYRDTNRSELIAKCVSYSAVYPSKKIKLKNCTLSISKYLVKARVIVNNEHPTSTGEPPFLFQLLARNKMNKFVIVDMEKIESIKITESEIKRIRHKKSK